MSFSLAQTCPTRVQREQTYTEVTSDRKIKIKCWSRELSERACVGWKGWFGIFSAPFHTSRDKSWPWQRRFFFLQRVFQAEGFRNVFFFLMDRILRAHRRTLFGSREKRFVNACYFFLLCVHHRTFIKLHNILNRPVLPHRHKRNLDYFCFYVC